jgi:hypothetical protein
MNRCVTKAQRMALPRSSSLPSLAARALGSAGNDASSKVPRAALWPLGPPRWNSPLAARTCVFYNEDVEHNNAKECVLHYRAICSNPGIRHGATWNHIIRCTNENALGFSSQTQKKSQRSVCRFFLRPWA